MYHVPDAQLGKWQYAEYKYYEHAKWALSPHNAYVRAIFNSKPVYADRFPKLSQRVIDLVLAEAPREDVTAVVRVLHQKIDEWWKREAVISRNKRRQRARAYLEATKGGCTDPFYVNGISPEVFGETCCSMVQVAEDIEAEIGLEDEPVPPMPCDCLEEE